MNLGKVVVSGVPAGIALFVIGAIAWAFTAPFYSSGPFAALGKHLPFGEWAVQHFVFYLAVGLILAGAYNILSGALVAEGLSKGFKFGLILWFVATLPGMGIIYLLLAVPDKIILSWLATGFVQNVIGCGLIGMFQESI